MHSKKESTSFLNLCLTIFIEQIAALSYNLVQSTSSLLANIILISSIMLIMIIYQFLKNKKISNLKYVLVIQFILRTNLLVLLLMLKTFENNGQNQNESFRIQYFLLGVYHMKYCRYKKTNNLLILVSNLLIIAGFVFTEMDFFLDNYILRIISFVIVSIFLIQTWYCQISKSKKNEENTNLKNVAIQSPIENKLEELVKNSNVNQQNSKQKLSLNLIQSSFFQNDEKIVLSERNDSKSIESHQFNDNFYKAMLNQYHEGISIFQSDKSLLFMSKTVQELFNVRSQRQGVKYLMNLRNCYEELQKQTQLSKAFQCLRQKLSQSRLGGNSGNDSHEEDDIQGESSEPYLSQQFNYSQSETVEQEFLKLLREYTKQISKIQNSCTNNFIQFFTETTMICSFDGLFVNQTLHSQTLTNFIKNSQNANLFQITLKPFLYKEQLQILIIVKDVTLFNQITILQSLNQNKTQMLSQVAHEFRTPLNCIILLIQSLHDEVSKQIQTDYLQPVLSSARQLLSLINDLLDLAQLKAEFDIRELLKEVETFLLRHIQEKGNQLKIEMKQMNTYKIVSDENRIRQILLNLISNANKFTSNGTITISVEQIDFNSYEIAVSDTGYGIEKADQEKLFKAFGRLENGKELNIQGVGLGLMISNILAQKLGEADLNSPTERNSFIKNGIKVFSEGLNLGSRFSFSIRSFIRMKESIRKNQKKETKISKFFQQYKKRSSLDENKEKSNSVFPRPPSTFAEFEKPYIQEFEQGVYSMSSKGAVSSGRISEIQKNENKINQIGQLNLNFNSCLCKEILIVDDEIFNIFALVQSLKKYNLKIDSAENGIMAIEKIMNYRRDPNCKYDCQNYKITLMDLEMPIMGGIETTKKIRKIQIAQEIYIIGCSGHSDKQIVKKCLECGMNDYLQKPLELNQLLKKIQLIHQ